MTVSLSILLAAATSERERQFVRVVMTKDLPWAASRGYHPTVFFDMLNRYRSVRGVAVALIHPNKPMQSGFWRINELGAGDTRSLEARVVEYADLFPEETVREAQKRLDALRWLATSWHGRGPQPRAIP